MVEAVELSLARVVHYPLPGANAPASVQFSPDGRLITYLWSEAGTLIRQLWAHDLESGETRLLARAPAEGDTDATVSREEALRRERLRLRGFGITTYAWAKKTPVLLVPVLGELFSGGEDGRLRQLEQGSGALDAQLNPAGTAVAFVREGELWVLGLEEGTRARQLTFGASPVNTAGERVRTNGLAEFIAQEEMGRGSGFWWSPDGSQLAFAEVDSSGVEPFTIAHDGAAPASAEVFRYPFAGQRNARVRVGIVRAEGSAVQWVPLPVDEDSYLARVEWTPDGALLAQVQTRDQRRLELFRFDPLAGRVETVLAERSETWVNLHDDLRLVSAEDSGQGEYQILWSSERTGFRHLYLYSHDGTEVRQLTRGEWAVDRVVGVHGGWVYFLAGRETPLERHLYRVSVRASLDGSQPERLSVEPGMHSAVLSPTGDCLVDLHDAQDQPPAAYLRAADGKLRSTIFAGDASEAQRLGLAPPEMLTVKAEDGTALYAALYRPSPAGSGAAPLIVSVYGGPHVQQVTNTWAMTVDLRAQYLARHGFAVLKLDNRGSARRGHAFEAAILGHLGEIEVRDQVAGVRTLTQDAAIDCDRVGIYGWSYGGYMALMCLLRAPEVFAAAVAGAPVTDWDGYDTHYTERYMRSPTDNPDGYRASSAVQQAAALRGALLIIHGMIDENVHFRHTARLINGLIEHGKPFALLPFPNERHMPRGEADRLYMEERLVEHFQRNLQPDARPAQGRRGA